MFRSLIFPSILSLVCAVCAHAASGDPLQSKFLNPPSDDRLAVFWLWSNATDEAAITRDLEAMAKAGVGRAVLSMTLAHSATITDGGGMVFLSPQFLKRFRFALDEASRLGIKITGIPSNGWYQGGPWVTPEMGAQMLVWSEKEVSGRVSEKLPLPDKFRPVPRASIAKTALEHLKPVATLAFQKDAEGRLLADSMVDLSRTVKDDGTLEWDAPAGNWVIYRFGHVPNMVRMKQDSPGYGGLQIDHFSRAAMERFLKEMADPMLEAAGPHVGKTLDRLHEDSMELGQYDWTPGLPAFFKAKTGYDLIPLLPALAGAKFSPVVDNGKIDRDFQTVLEDLLIEEHFGPFREYCRQHGVSLVAESGETRSGIATKGSTVDHVMDEFWTHYGLESDHPVCFNRNAVFAAHVYGQNRNTCEAFTSHQQWRESPAQLKALANEVYAVGVNHLTIHGFSSSPLDTPPPGDVYFAGTHFNPGVTWWNNYARPLTSYFNRIQTMQAAGLPVTDLLYLDGPALQEMIKSNEMLRQSDRRFWKFDGIPAGLLAETASVNAEGRIELPNGQTYAVLVVADEATTLDAMRTVERLANAGATVWFQSVPDSSSSHADGPSADKEIQAITKRMGAGSAPGVHPFGKGWILTGADRSRAVTLGEGVRAWTFYDGLHAAAMDQLGIAPAFAYRSNDPDARLFFFQRNAEGADVFFVANALRTNVQADCTFRVTGKQPELWDPVSGTIHEIEEFSTSKSGTVIPLEFAPHESRLVVFRKPVTGAATTEKSERKSEQFPVNGPWKISFEPARNGIEPFSINSDSLFRWDQSTDKRIAEFSGTAAYQTTFNVPESLLKSGRQILLDLGQSPGLSKLTGAGGGKPPSATEDAYDSLCAEVIVNGRPAGTLWCSPYRIDISTLAKPGKNTLEIRVTNTWHNWRIANKFTASSHAWEKLGLSLPRSPSGLPGPVTLRAGAATNKP